MRAAIITLGCVTLLGGVYLARRINRIADEAADAIDMADYAGELAVAIGCYASRNEGTTFELVEADIGHLTEN